MHLVGNRFYVIRNNTCYKMITRKWNDILRRVYAVCERVPPRIADDFESEMEEDIKSIQLYIAVICPLQNYAVTGSILLKL